MALVSRQKTDGTSTNRLGIELTARTNIDIAELETPLDGDANVGLAEVAMNDSAVFLPIAYGF